MTQLYAAELTHGATNPVPRGRRSTHLTMCLPHRAGSSTATPVLGTSAAVSATLGAPAGSSAELSTIDAITPEVAELIDLTAQANACSDRSPPRNVKRHWSRGVDPESSREKRREEDRSCNAGMRNPNEVLARWPSLIDAMKPVRTVLLEALAADAGFGSLLYCLGPRSSQPPPAD